MIDIYAIQTAIRSQGLDGWLLYDFRGLNVLAQRILRFPADAHATRRWFYFIPAEGEPRKLNHRIEPNKLAYLPGSGKLYLRWQELEAGIAALLSGAHRIAMEYVPRNSNPYISRIDAGTIELIQSFGIEVVSSGDLISQFEATWDDEQWSLHQAAERVTTSAFDTATDFIRSRLRAGAAIRETDAAECILAHFQAQGAVTDSLPIVGVGPHSGDPHYSPVKGKDSPIRPGDFVLIDLWAKMNHPRAVYSDLTRVYYIGDEVPGKIRHVFDVVAAARDAAIGFLRDQLSVGATVQGWQVDQAARDVIEKCGYGEYFCHRLGHSIGQETHGNGAHMDNLETHEQRKILPRTCFSIEPGVYLPEFGVRSEVNVFIGADQSVHVTGGPVQKAVGLITL